MYTQTTLHLHCPDLETCRLIFRSSNVEDYKVVHNYHWGGRSHMLLHMTQGVFSLTSDSRDISGSQPIIPGLGAHHHGELAWRTPDEPGVIEEILKITGKSWLSV